MSKKDDLEARATSNQPLCGEECLEYKINSFACFDCQVIKDLWQDLTGEGDYFDDEQQFLEDHSQG